MSSREVQAFAQNLEYVDEEADARAFWILVDEPEHLPWNNHCINFSFKKENCCTALAKRLKNDRKSKIGYSQAPPPQKKTDNTHKNPTKPYKTMQTVDVWMVQRSVGANSRCFVIELKFDLLFSTLLTGLTS